MTAVPVGVTGRTAAGLLKALPAAVVDALFVLGLGTLGVVGFRTVYGGHAYLLVGALGLALGVCVTELARKLRQPVLAEAFVTLLAFLILGGAVAVPAGVVGGVIPTGKTISALGHVGVYGWKELLTTAPPVGDSSNLLALPYILGLVGGVAGQSLARRTRSAAIPLCGPGLVLALGILFGGRQPASVMLQGSLFGAGAVAWTVLRHHRFRTILKGGSVTAGRVASGVAFLAAAAVLATFVGPHLPGSGRSRVVLSRYVVPPFEANQQPSPLAGFRQYVKGSSLYASVLFTVTGAPTGSLVRIATMDEYDGIVWGFGAGGPESATKAGDSFQRFGSVIPTTSTGQPTPVSVQIGALGGVWLPDLGQTTGVKFSGSDAAQLARNFRYDTATDTAAEPTGVHSGESYRLDALLTSSPSPSQLAAAAPGDATLSITGIPSILQSDAAQWSAGGSGAWAQVSQIAAHLKQAGYYSDGTDPGVGAAAPVLSAPGHGYGRLITFLQGGGLVGTNIVGDDEQYAATLALMANSIGVPARVVLGAGVPAGGAVKGADVHAWVEVALSGLGWVPIPWTSFLPTRQAHQSPPQHAPRASSSAPVEPPIVSALHSPPPDLVGGNSTSAASRFAHPPSRHGPLLPRWLVTAAEYLLPPLLVVFGVVASIVGLKRRRRTRRRRAVSASAQIAGGWAELLDTAIDLGLHVPGGRTRREQARTFPLPEAGPLAVAADSAVFAPGEPTAEQVSTYWASVEQLAGQLRSGLGRAARWRSAVSLRSFRWPQTSPAANS